MSPQPRTHRSSSFIAAAAVTLGALAAPGALPTPAGATTALSVERIATGLTRPVLATSPSGDARLFIVEQRGADQRGRIRIYKDGALLPTPFLTTAPLATGNEQGLLGLAFPPDFATSGVFYINYTSAGGAGTTRLARHHVSVGNPDRADSLGEVFFSLTQPFTNHNGGWLGFGPDGYLYVAVGDGGDAGDPGDRAQNLNSHFGKLLRLDVSGATGYLSPATNPYVGVAGTLPEIWSFGLRNPFRCSFDRATGDLIIGDVGQLSWEEVDFAKAPERGRAANYGWKCWEGNHPYGTSTTTPCTSCTQTSCFVFPAHEYDHSGGRCSITGGYVYRGCAIPDLQGTYFFGDYCSGQVYSGKFAGGVLTGVTDRATELALGTPYVIDQISSFGEDAAGEIYLCDLGGQVYKIVPRTGVAEADMAALSMLTSSGDVLGASAPGNAHLPGITPFADAGQRLEDVPLVFRSFGLFFQFFGLAVGQLERRRQRLGEVVPAQRERADPHPPALRDDQIGRRRPDVEDHRPGSLRRERDIERHRVVHRHRAERDDVGHQPLIPVLGQNLCDFRLRDRKDPHLDVRAVVARERLVVPFHVVDRERDLLHRLESNQIGDPLLLHRRKFRKPGKRAVTGDRERDRRPPQRIPILAHERPQRHRDRLVPVQFGGREHLLMGHHRKVGDPQLLAVALDLERLDRARSDLNSPAHVR